MSYKLRTNKDEEDMLYWKDYKYLERAGVKKAIKRRMNKRQRREQKMDLQKELLE